MASLTQRQLPVNTVVAEIFYLLVSRVLNISAFAVMDICSKPALTLVLRTILTEPRQPVTTQRLAPEEEQLFVMVCKLADTRI